MPKPISIVDVAPTLAFLNPFIDLTFFGLHIFMVYWIALYGFSQTKIFKERFFWVMHLR